MFERFTDRARKVMALANQEAQRFNHEYIGTEHILLGLVKEGSGVGATVLKNLYVDIKKLRLEVEKLVKSGPDMVTIGKLPQTPEAKKVIEYAIEEARLLNHNYVGTEHILLGLLRESEGIAAQALMNLGLKLEDVRQEVLNLLGAGNMFEHFTDRSRKVMALANQEAQRLNHEYIDTEHILLGLIKEGSGIGATILKNRGVDIKTLRIEIGKRVEIKPDRITMGKLPQTQGAKKVIEYAIEEKREMEKQLNRRLDVDTKHILLGLLREGEGIAAQVLMNLGLQIEQVRGVFLALEGEKEPVMERGPRTWEDKGKKKPLVKQKGKVSMNEDEQYLKLLSVFHYVVGGLVAFFACIFLFHLCIGVAMLTGAIDDAPIFVGLMLVIMSIVAITLGWTLAVCMIVAGRCLAKRKRYMFCLVIAAISCIFMPFGTVLGVFTIIVLMRPSVKELFAANLNV